MEEAKENNNLDVVTTNKGGAPVGNTNSKKGKLFHGELRKALIQNDQLNLRLIADKLVEEAINGESWAIKEVIDRVDGKAVQTTEVSGIDGEAMELKLIEFVVKQP